MVTANGVATPMPTTSKLMILDGQPLSSATKYCHIVGCLQYLSLTRPDIAFSVNKLSQFMTKPTDIHWTTVKRLLCYLHPTAHFGLFLKWNSPFHLHGFSDADWVGNSDDCTSTTGYIIFLGSNPISWSSRKQRFVSRSSTEAEYSTVAHTVSEIYWLVSLLQELHVKSSIVPTIYCDNLGTTYVSANPKLHSKMKHVRIEFHFMREEIKDGSIRVSHISSKD